jgi:hypothetical protein
MMKLMDGTAYRLWLLVLYNDQARRRWIGDQMEAVTLQRSKADLIITERDPDLVSSAGCHVYLYV